MTKIIVIGAVAAGSKASAKIKRLDVEAQVKVYTEDTHVAYSACGLPYYIEGNFSDWKKLVIRTPEEFEKNGINVFVQHRVIKILPNTKKIVIENLVTKDIFKESYDKLLIATGAKPIIPHIKNCHLENVFTLRTLEDGIAIRKKMESSKHVTIVGGGSIGVELLEAFSRQNLNVTMIEFNKTIMSGFDEDIGTLLQEKLKEVAPQGTKIISNDLVTEFTTNDDINVSQVKTKNGENFETDFVVICAGVYPNVKIALEAGIRLGETGAILVNNQMETSIKDIWAAGDCVEKQLIVSGQKGWIPLGSTANKEGRCAALNICGTKDVFNGILQSQVTRCFNFTMAKTGMSEKQAILFGFNPISKLVTKKAKASYIPNVQTITIKLTADKNTHKILGCQGIGLGDVDKRVNTITTGLIGKLTIEEFFSDDITYAPPFSPSIDPLLTAAQHLISALNSGSSANFD